MSDQKTLSNQRKPTIAGESIHGRSLNTKIFLGFLFLTSCLYAVILVYHVNRPPETVTDQSGLLEQCRQICLQYGLVSTGNVRKDAESYIEAVKLHQDVLAQAAATDTSSFKPQPTHTFALLNQQAPDFELPDDGSVRKNLTVIGKDRPVVVVFYLGYGCSHCVAQLIGLDKDLKRFHELGAEIVAISSDTPEHTAEKYVEYGRFHFPVLADVDYAVSTAWGVYQPATDEKSEVMNHGTFILNSEGKIIWGQQGKEPFLDNQTLLHVIAAAQGSSTGEPHAETAAVIP
jgi:peroxiredoxin Q/BCP